MVAYGGSAGVAAAGIAVTGALAGPLGGLHFLVALALLPVYALLAGAGPALLATALSTLGMSLFFFEPINRVGVSDPHAANQLLFFALVGMLLSAIGGAQKRARARTAEQAHAAAERANEVRAAAEQVKASDERYHLAGLATHDVLWDWDLLSDRVSWSEALESAFGFPPGQVPPTVGWWADQLHPDDRQATLVGVEAAVAQADTQFWQAEYRFRHRDGGYRAVLDRGYLRRDAQGRAVRMIGSMQDLTERTRTQEELRNSREEFRQLAEAMPQLVWSLRPDGTALFCNRQWYEYMGLSPEDAAGDAWISRLHPDDVERTLQRWRHSLATDEPYEVECRLRSAQDGQYRWFLARAVLVETAGTKKWLGTSTNIDAQKRAESRFAAEQKRLAVILSSLPIGAVITDAQGRVMQSNEMARDLWAGSYPSQGIADYSHYRGWWPGSGKLLAAEEWSMARALLRGETVVGEVVDIERFDGTRGTILSNAAPISDESGRITGGVLLVLDITAQKRDQEALKAANARLMELDQSKNAFLAMLSHELRNPLAPIRSSLYVLEHATPGAPQRRHAQEVIARQVGHLTRLIDDLLDVTRISRGKIHLQLARVELGGLVRQAADDHRSLFEANGVRFEVSVGPGPLFARADPTRLSQVIGNLLSNAAKFGSRGGRVRLSLEARGAMGEIRVRDDGVGIPPQILPNLFQPFVQAESTIARSKGGLGLGLALVKGLMDLHGGKVWASSEGAGRGAEFGVQLPLERGEAPAATAGRESPAGEVPRDLRVLVIEDNHDAAEMLKEALELHGHAVDTAADGLQGLERARGFHPHVVVCDLGLPGIDGFEVARRMHADQDLRSAALIAVSGYAAPDDVQRSKGAGFLEHLAKPPDLDRLESLVARLGSQARTGYAQP
ncbi:MAG: PAS domain-containing protein [Myxococcales bacterium]